MVSRLGRGLKDDLGGGAGYSEKRSFGEKGVGSLDLVLLGG